MAIRITDRSENKDVYVTWSELARYNDEYYHAHLYDAGTPPTLEEFIRNKQKANSHD